jgi:hypothetical protein
MNQEGPDPSDPDGGGSADSLDPAGPPEAVVNETAEQAADAPSTPVDAQPHIETNEPVDTEAVDVPPVTVATVDRPQGRRRVGGRVAAVVAVVGVLVIAGVAYAGYSLNQDLATTRTTLGTTEDDLGSTQSTLEETSSTLATTRTQLAERTDARETLDAEITELAAQVASQAECVRLQEAALTELMRLSDLQTESFNRTAEGSAWATADKKRADNIEAALDAFYAAYSQAFEGNKGSAKTQADRGNRAQSNIAEADAELTSQVNTVNTKAGEISVMIDELEQQLVTIESTCGGRHRDRHD